MEWGHASQRGDVRNASKLRQAVENARAAAATDEPESAE
jgi:hypothetical protein